MGVPAFSPAPHINADEFARGLRAPSRLPRISESSSGFSQCASNTLEPVGAEKESIERLDVGSSPGDGTSIVDTDDLRTIDDFRRWWQHRLPQGAAQDHFRGRKLTRIAIVLAGIALISSALAPTLLKRQPVAHPANNTVRAETAGTPADISSMSPTGVSAATPVAPETDPQAVEGLAYKASTQITDPEPARSVSVRADAASHAAGGRRSRSPGRQRTSQAQIASQVSSSAEPGSAADARKQPVKPASGPVNGAVGTAQPSFDLPAKRPEAAIPSAAVDTPSPPLPIGTPSKPEREASGAKALQRLVESVVASATPSKAPAAGSTGWVVQLGARSSEAEAKRDLKRLNTKYGSALKGSTAGTSKVLLNGETVYRLHVDGLPRDKAVALCSRVKSDGGSCSIVR